MIFKTLALVAVSTVGLMADDKAPPKRELTPEESLSLETLQRKAYQEAFSLQNLLDVTIPQQQKKKDEAVNKMVAKQAELEKMAGCSIDMETAKCKPEPPKPVTETDPKK